MVEIRVPVERLREVAKSLETQRQEADNLLQSALSLVDGVYGEWSGLAQVDYAQMFNDQVPPIRARFNEMLEGLVQALRRIADDFERTDEQAVDGSAVGAVGVIGAGVGAVGGGTGGNSGSNDSSSGGDSSGGGSRPPGHASPPEQTPPAISPGVHRVEVNPGVTTHDCVAYVKGQREVPAPILTWQNGGVDDNWNYGPAPQPGAIMVEGYDPAIQIGAEINGTKWGHVSYVDWVEYNDAGVPIRFHIVEGGWEGGQKHEQTFDWPIGDSSRRHPHRFVYDKKA